MSDKQKNEIIDNLAQRLQEYVLIILKEYADVINPDDIIRLKKINNYKDEIKITDTGTITCLVTPDKKMLFPESVNKILNIVKRIPGSGMKKNHKSYNEDNIIINNNTFETYMKHTFLKGNDVKEFYEENLLHESMHFCGAGGAGPLLEGLTEHRTRELAKKYNLKTTGCGYPKEVKIVDELQQIFGEKFMSMYLFNSGGVKSTMYLIENYGVEALHFFENVEKSMSDEFKNKYYDKTMNFKGLLAPIKKAKAYSELKYKDVYNMIDDYKKTLIGKNINEHVKKDDYEEQPENNDNIQVDIQISNGKEIKKVLQVHNSYNKDDMKDSRGVRK